MGEIIPRPLPPAPLPFTGERLTSSYHGQTEIEHFHRYLLAREWCRGKDVLDVASGEGYGTALLAQVARTAVGVEIDEQTVVHAAQSYGKDNLRYLKADARSLPVEANTFDVVISFETIEHFGEQRQFIEEVHRILKPGGLFIVSTPERDIYSPTETPANPYHVRELTREEFVALLGTEFANVSILLQRPIFGSVMLPAGNSGVAQLCFERRGSSHFEASLGLARPQYILAFASDAEMASMPTSVFIETGRLGMLNPSDAAAELEDLRSMLETERGRAQRAAEEAKRHIEAELQDLRSELETEGTLRRTETERLAQLEAERNLLVSEIHQMENRLAEASGEARGLLVANEATERACAALRDELRSAHANGVRMEERIRGLQAGADANNARMEERIRGLEAAAGDNSALMGEQIRSLEKNLEETRNWARELEARLTRSEFRLTNILGSHSWRVTAPLRRISRMIYRRP